MPTATPQANLANQFRNRIKQAINWLPGHMKTDDAVELLLGTAARESQFGKFKDRAGAGGLGPFQINPNTEAQIWNSYLKQKPGLAKGLSRVTGVAGPNPQALINNFPYAASMARLAYTRSFDPIPSRHAPEEMANYWKKWYNTSAGEGTPEGFLETYSRLVKGGQDVVE